jgi:hypothetical protein
MASEKTQASFDAVTSKLNSLSAKDDVEVGKDTPAKKEGEAIKTGDKTGENKVSKPEGKSEEACM